MQTNLSDHKVLDSTSLQIKCPKGNPIGIWFEMYGAHTSQYSTAMVNEQRRVLASKNPVGRGEADFDESGNRLLIAVIKRWWSDDGEGKTVPTILDGKQQLEFNPENALLIFKKYRFIRNQIDRHMHSEANFLESAQKN